MDPANNKVFKYDADNKTLIVKGSAADPNKQVVENTSVDGLVVDFQTTSVLLGKGGIKTSKDLIVTSSTGSKGTITANGSSYCGIYALAGTLTIKDVTLEINGDWPITGTITTGAELTFNKANVTATSTSTNNAVSDFGKISFIDCGILTPAGAQVGQSIKNADGSIAQKVVISTSVSAIDAVEVEQNADVKTIYDASGRQTQTARPGLNIIRMSDGTVRKVMVK